MTIVEPAVPPVAVPAAAAPAVPKAPLIGVIPWPVYLVLIATIAGFVATGKIPTDISVTIAILAVGGFTCAELGRRLPVLRALGVGAIFATFIPSYLVFAHLLPAPLIANVKDFTKASNFLYLFIAAIIVGSILSMDRNVLVRGFLKIFVPLAAGSLAAGAVGFAVGRALGIPAFDIVFYILVPVMGGGVGEGAIPLSVGYGAVLGQDPGILLAHILPSVMFASLTAIVFAGLLNAYGRTRPHLTGYGRLQRAEVDDLALLDAEPAAAIGAGDVAAAGITAVALYCVGVLGQKLTNFPAPITMLVLAVALNLLRLVGPALQAGAHSYYRFFATAVTYPLLFAIGVSLTPWQTLIAAFTWPVLVTIVATVTTLMATGWFVGSALGMYPIESAIVNACHSGQGGTGDIAILTAADRLPLMPFAQIATRIGGAITVTLALIAITRVAHS